MFPRPLTQASPALRRAYRIALVAALLLWLVPLIGVALTSIRSADDLARGNFWGWPSDVSLLQNYATVLGASRMGQFVLNSFAIAIPAVAGTLILSCMSGFALAKCRLPGSVLILAMFIAGNLSPFQSLMIPVRELMVKLGLYDTRWALIVFHIAFQTGFGTLLMRNFMRQVPDALIETARLLGASEFRILWDIVLPLIRPAIGAVAVLTFTFVWNDYFWALVLVHSDAVRPVTAGLQSLQGMWVVSWHLTSAAAILAAIPPVAVFVLMQRHFISGLAVRSQPSR
jgi:multiple sugar transport system permease protein